jgi:hypothetical protein
MRLGKKALLEIMAIVLEGLSEGKDISEMLRKLDFVADIPGGVENDGELNLSARYIEENRRVEKS